LLNLWCYFCVKIATASAAALAVVLLQVTALALGRLYVKMQADATLGQLLLPLLADVLCQGAMPTHSSTTGTGLSGSGSAAGSAGGGAIAHSSSDDGAGGRWHQGLSAEAAGAVVCALEGMASMCVQQSSNTWLYDQALQLLLMMYREPTQVRLAKFDVCSSVCLGGGNTWLYHQVLQLLLMMYREPTQVRVAACAVCLVCSLVGMRLGSDL
jgi:hypothetical protein